MANKNNDKKTKQLPIESSAQKIAVHQHKPDGVIAGDHEEQFDHVPLSSIFSYIYLTQMLQMYFFPTSALKVFSVCIEGTVLRVSKARIQNLGNKKLNSVKKQHYASVDIK